MNGNQNPPKKILIFFFLIGIIFISVVIPKLPNEMRKSFLVGFLISYPLTIFFLYKLIGGQTRKEKSIGTAKFKEQKTFKSYQDFLIKYRYCSQKIKQYQYWSVGCLIVGCIIVWINKNLDTPLYEPSFFQLLFFL